MEAGAGLAWRRNCVRRISCTRRPLPAWPNQAHLANADVDLDTHINEITDLIRTERLNNVVLCGHSYGGMVVTGVADRILPQIASIVYLDSFVPHDGDSVLSLTGWSIPNAV